MTSSRIIRYAAGATLGLLASAPAFAQAAQSAPAQQPQQFVRTEVAAQLDSEFKDLDANHDGKLTKAEMEAAMSRRAAEAQAKINADAKDMFTKMDTNHNGSISLAEFQAAQKIGVNTARVDSRFQELDANHDGIVSADEYRNATLADFDKADTNHDGVVNAADNPPSR